MRSSKHFESGSDKNSGNVGNMGGKINAFLGGNGFGGNSSKNQGMHTITEGMEGAKVNGGLSIGQLEEHTKRMASLHLEESKDESKDNYDSD